MLKETTNFNEVADAINSLCDTRIDYTVHRDSHPLLSTLNFSKKGLQQAGTKLDFPVSFLTKLENDEHGILADEILRTRYQDFFNKAGDNTTLLERTFNGKICALLSTKYNKLDDDEILPILQSNRYLMDECGTFWYHIDESHTHIRFISNKKLYTSGDDSPLSMAVFIDNSMTGASCLTVRFGLYRWACTNGMISGLKEFSIAKERHYGKKDLYAITLSALENVALYEKMLLDEVERMQVQKSFIYDMDEEDAIIKIKNYLNTSKKLAEKVYEAYFNVYNATSVWDMCNAITYVARDLDIDTRTYFERRAFM